MTNIDQVFTHFVDAWTAGERPQVREYLAKVPADQRDDLADALSEWLVDAPTPVFSATARASLEADPLFQRVMAEAEARPLHQELPRLRMRLSLSVRDVASKVVTAVGMAGGKVDQTEDYLKRAERGELDPSRFSQRLLDALSSALEVPGNVLSSAAGPMPAAAAPAVSFRTDGNQGHERAARDLDALTAAAMAPSPRSLDDVDVLFLGGRDA